MYYLGHGEQVARFAEQFVVQTKGRWAGRPMELEPWQRKLLDELYLVDGDGNLVYREALIGVPRKNGKSTFSAAIALYGLMASGEQGAEVYAAAASKDQAGVVFNQARDFVEASPELLRWLRPQRNVIVCPGNGGIFRVLSSDAPLQYGLNPSLVVIDELWAHKNAELYYALTTGQLARENPLVVSITTAGFDRESVCWQVYERGRALAEEGTQAMRDARFFFKWFEAPDDCEVTDPDAWHQANPSSWIEDEDLAREAERLPEFVFRRLHLNQWTELEDAWVSGSEWDQCRGEVKFDEKEPTWGGVDVGIKRDSSAFALAQWHGDKLHVKVMIEKPEDHDDNWGVSDVREAAGKFYGSLKMKGIGFDPWNFRESAEELLERGLPMVQFDQNASQMSRASENLYELIQDGRLVHDGDEGLRQQVLATVVQATDRGWRISKRKSQERIDATVALAIAADRALDGRLEKPQGSRVHFL